MRSEVRTDISSTPWKGKSWVQAVGLLGAALQYTVEKWWFVESNRDFGLDLSLTAIYLQYLFIF